jgi:hypothetical protein
MNHILSFQSIPHNLSRPELHGSLLVFSQEGLEVVQLEDYLEIDQVCSKFELKTVCGQPSAFGTSILESWIVDSRRLTGVEGSDGVA